MERDTERVGTIVGRDRELAEVSRALADARGGQGRLLLVSGPAGIGKTTLALAAAADAERLGMTVTKGWAVDDPGAPVLWPWSRALRGWPVLADWTVAREPADEPDAAARFRMFAAVTAELSSRAGGVGLLLVLEDMHWADRTSVLLLRHLAAEVAAERICVLVTIRDTAPCGAMSDAVGDLVRGEYARLIELAGLTADDLVSWLPQLTPAADPALAKPLHDRTSGNPLLVRLVAEDLTRHSRPAGQDEQDASTGHPSGGGQPGVPEQQRLDKLMAERPQLRRLVAARVAALGADSRDVVEAASVLAERVVPDLVAVVCDRPAAQAAGLLEQAVAAGVLRAVGPDDGLSFEHSLVRDAVYASISPPRRASLHRRVAVALADREPGLAGTIAAHWERAGGGADAARHCRTWAERADDQARRALAWSDAARYAELAATRARQAGEPNAEQARLLIRLAEVQFLAHTVPASLQTCREAADLAEAAGRPDLIAQAGLVIHGIGDPRVYRIIAALCERALAALPEDAHAQRARLHAQLAVGVAEARGGPRAAEVAAQALREAERSADPAAILEAVAARHLAISVPHQVAERLELGRRAIALSGSSNQPVAALWGHLWRFDAAMQLGNMEAASQELTEIDRIAAGRKSALAAWHHSRLRAVRAALSGDFPAARAATADARALAETCADRSMTGMASAFLLQLAVLRGDPAELDDEFHRSVREAPPFPVVRISYPLYHAISGRLDQAREEFEEFRQLAVTYPKGVRWLGTIVLVATTAALLGDAAAAADLYPLFVPLTRYYAGDGSGLVFSHGALARLAGDMALTAGHPADAVPHYRQAIAMNSRIGARPFTALSRLGLARALSTGQPGEQALAEAADLTARAAAEFRRLDRPGPLPQ